MHFFQRSLTNTQLGYFHFYSSVFDKLKTRVFTFIPKKNIVNNKQFQEGCDLGHKFQTFQSRPTFKSCHIPKNYKLPSYLTFDTPKATNPSKQRVGDKINELHVIFIRHKEINKNNILSKNIKVANNKHIHYNVIHIEYILNISNTNMVINTESTLNINTNT